MAKKQQLLPPVRAKVIRFPAAKPKVKVSALNAVMFFGWILMEIVIKLMTNANAGMT